MRSEGFVSFFVPSGVLHDKACK